MPPGGAGTGPTGWANSARKMLVLRRQEELGGQICLRIVQNHMFIAISERPGGRDKRAGTGGSLPTFLQILTFFKKTG